MCQSNNNKNPCPDWSRHRCNAIAIAVIDFWHCALHPPCELKWRHTSCQFIINESPIRFDSTENGFWHRCETFVWPLDCKQKPVLRMKNQKYRLKWQKLTLFNRKRRTFPSKYLVSFPSKYLVSFERKTNHFVDYFEQFSSSVWTIQPEFEHKVAFLQSKLRFECIMCGYLN